jgi:hypothetical protein
MLHGKVPHHDIGFGSYQRSDGQKFKLTARLFELPSECDYWQATYDVEHDQWGHMRFVLTVPKKIASSVDFARALVTGLALSQVKACLNTASANGRELTPYFAFDGWVLI